MKKTAIIFSLFAVAALALTTGCGQKLPDGMPKLYPTNVTITVDGNPVEAAMVTAFPADPAFNWPIGGSTDAAGNVTLVTAGQYPGAPAGELTICVMKTRNVYGPTYDTPKPTDSRESSLAWDRAVEKERTEFRMVGVEYNSKETSPLKMTIQKGKNTEKFDIPEDGTQIKFAK